MDRFPRITAFWCIVFAVLPNLLFGQLTEKFTWREDLDNGFQISTKAEIGGFLYVGGTTISDKSRYSPWLMKLDQQAEVVWHSDLNFPTGQAGGPGIIEVIDANENSLLIISLIGGIIRTEGFIVGSVNKKTGAIQKEIKFDYYRPVGCFKTSDSTFVLIRSGNRDSLVFEEYSANSFKLLKQFRTEPAVDKNENLSSSFDGQRFYVASINGLVSLDKASFSDYKVGPILKNSEAEILKEISLIKTPENQILGWSKGSLFGVDSLSLDTTWTYVLPLGKYNYLSDYLFKDSSLFISTLDLTSAGYTKPTFNIARINYLSRKFDYFAQPKFDSIPTNSQANYSGALDIELDQNKQLYAAGFYSYDSFRTPALMKINPENGEKIFERSLRILNNKSSSNEDNAYFLYIPKLDPMVLVSVLDTITNTPKGYKVPNSLNLVTFNGGSKNYKSWKRIPLAYHFGSYTKSSSTSPSGTFVVRQRGQRGEAVFYNTNNEQKWVWSPDNNSYSYAIGGATIMGYHYVLVGFSQLSNSTNRVVDLPRTSMYTLDMDGNVIRIDSNLTKLNFTDYYNKIDVFVDGNQIFFAEYFKDPGDWYIYISSYNVVTRKANKPKDGVHAYDGTFDRFHRSIIKTDPGQYYVLVQTSYYDHALRPLVVNPQDFSLETATNSNDIKPFDIRDAAPWAKDTIVMIGGDGPGGPGTAHYVYYYFPSTRKAIRIYLKYDSPVDGKSFNTIWLDSINRKINVFGLNKDSLVVHKLSKGGTVLDEIVAFKLTDGNPGYITKSFFDSRNQVFYVSGYTERASDNYRSIFILAVDTAINLKSSYFGEYLPENEISTLAPFKLGDVLVGGNYKDRTQRFGFINTLTTGAIASEQKNTLEKFLPSLSFSNQCGASSDLLISGKVNLYNYDGISNCSVRITLGIQSITLSLNPVLIQNKHTANFSHTFFSLPQGSKNIRFEYFIQNQLVDSINYPTGIGSTYCPIVSGALFDDQSYQNCIYDSWIEKLVPTDSLPVMVNDVQLWFKKNYTFSHPTDQVSVLKQLPFITQISPNTYRIFTPSCDSSYTVIGTQTQHLPYIFRDSVFTVGTSSLDPNNWTVYPNPASNRIWIACSESGLAKQLTVLDLTGRIVYTQLFKSMNTTVDISALSPGFYTFLIQDSEEGIKQFVISKIGAD